MYQFIHIEGYARESSTKAKPSSKKATATANTPQARLAAAGGANAPKGMDAFTKADGSKGKKGKSTMSDVIREALREDDHCNHVDVPQSPTFLLGDPTNLWGLRDEIEAKCAVEKARTGKAPRKDMHVLLAGVASYPRALAIEDPAGYDRWEKATVKWLREKYGDNLRAVLKHDDEAHPHVHFFVCDRIRVNAKELHDGYAAAAHLPLSKESNQVFNDAMRDFQSDYYAKVGHAAGLQRDGPKRLRLDRATHNARNREARERVALTLEAEKAMGSLLDDAAIEARTAAELRREVNREAGVLAVERVELEQLRDTLQRERAAVDGEWCKARESRAAAASFEADASRKLSTLDKQEANMERARTASDEAKAEARLATVARDREADALRTEKVRASALAKKLEGQLAGLGDIKDIAAIVRKPGAVAMLEFIEQNPNVRKVLDVLKAEPFLAETFVEIAQPHEALGLQFATWESQKSNASQEFLDSLHKPAEQGRNTGFDMGS